MTRRTAGNSSSRAKSAATATPVDHTILSTLLCDDGAAVHAVLAQFHASGTEDARALCAALRGGNKAAALRLAHRLKGGSRMVGAGRMAELCESAENAVRDGDAPSLRAIVAELEGEAARLAEYLRGWLDTHG